MGLPRNNWGAVAGAVLVSALVAALSALGQQLNAGAVPIPPELAWLVPIAVPALGALAAALTPYIRREG